VSCIIKFNINFKEIVYYYKVKAVTGTSRHMSTSKESEGRWELRGEHS